MECFGTTDFDNNSRLITLSAIIISGLHCTIFFIIVKLYMFRAVSPSIFRSSRTVHTAHAVSTVLELLKMDGETARNM